MFSNIYSACFACIRFTKHSAVFVVASWFLHKAEVGCCRLWMLALFRNYRTYILKHYIPIRVEWLIEEPYTWILHRHVHIHRRHHRHWHRHGHGHWRPRLVHVKTLIGPTVAHMRRIRRIATGAIVVSIVSALNFRIYRI